MRSRYSIPIPRSVLRSTHWSAESARRNADDDREDLGQQASRAAVLGVVCDRAGVGGGEPVAGFRRRVVGGRIAHGPSFASLRSRGPGCS